MTGGDLLSPWTQLQALYVLQFVELGRPEVNLTRVRALAGQAEALLVRLSSPEALRACAHDPQTAQRISAAAAQAQLLLQRTTAALSVARARLLSRAQHTQRASAAALAYRAKDVRTAARYLDQRR